ncbi:MAG: hypothetical protein EBT27_12120 [Betaproteobacteria bacterium]|nr:hypothetical protein [Betaproteobacteria bacterium]
MPVARLLYTLVLLAALPCVPLILLWQSRRNPGYRRHWGERLLGLSAGSSASDAKHPLIWIHAVSVGETRARGPAARRSSAAHSADPHHPHRPHHQRAVIRPAR